MPLAARVGDAHACPQKGHSVNNIVSGSDNVFINGLPASRLGDTTSCGATIVAGSSTVFINGKPAALMGSATSHGGVIIGGSDNVLIGDIYTPASTISDSLVEKAFNQHFQLIDQSGNPVKGFTYLLQTPDGEITGETCEQGKTDLCHSHTMQSITLAHAFQSEIGVKK
ncbi:PAAR domain-containing protein [Tolumonas osonensis]|uniref:Putative Zn-binding protein involved in type VI secretion n=1 Tax=Tolumonas osonensis TaxID=675874 RepID=A0A841GF14_9GAMM|nr:PAAR domain-containing protein [Tolumonas osonensis]MBB6056157.1 putative Zn-binding protein involved in type VI secretion [Tolumonas osonensis]